MTANQFLRRGQAEAGAFRLARDERIEHRVLQVGGYARSVIFDFYRGDDTMSNVAYREVGNGSASQREGAVAIERSDRIAHEVQERLHHLVAIEVDLRQARIVISVHGQLFLVFRLDKAHDVLEKFVDIDRLLVGRTARAEQRVDQSCESICLTDNDIRVFSQLRIIELTLQQLRCTADTTERILYFVRKLSNHLPTRTVLNQQCVLAADLVAACYIGHFNQQLSAVEVDGRHSALNRALLGMYLGR
jgi:hypothetical protein